MTRTQTAVLGVAVIGAIDAVLSVAAAEVSPTMQMILLFAPTVVLLGLLFWRLHYDSISHNFRRSPMFNVGIVVLGIVFVPVYLFRSRPPGARLRAIAAFFGVLLLYAAAYGIAEAIADAAT